MNFCTIFKFSSFTCNCAKVGSCFKPVWVSFFCWTQRTIFWRTKQLMDPFTSIVYIFSYNRSQWVQFPVWFFKISSFVFNRRKKLIPVWNNLKRVNDDRIVILKWTIPLRRVYARLRWWLSYKSLIELVFSAFIVVWFGHLTLTNRNRLNSLDGVSRIQSIDIIIDKNVIIPYLKNFNCFRVPAGRTKLF